MGNGCRDLAVLHEALSIGLKDRESELVRYPFLAHVVALSELRNCQPIALADAAERGGKFRPAQVLLLDVLRNREIERVVGRAHVVIDNPIENVDTGQLRRPPPALTHDDPEHAVGIGSHDAYRLQHAAFTEVRGESKDCRFVEDRPWLIGLAMIRSRKIRSCSVPVRPLHHRYRGTVVQRYRRQHRGEPARAPGWAGKAALSLRLEGDIAVEHLVNALDGRHPYTGERLRSWRKDRIAGWDFTISPPKSVSAVWAVADWEDRECIEELHRDAVRALIGYAEGRLRLVRRSGNGLL